MSKVYRGVIEDVRGSWGSGLATLVLKDPDGNMKEVYADNGPLIRSLDSAFGEVIQEGHTFSVGAVRGQELVYAMDDMGLCRAGFVPLADWDGDEVPAEGLEVQ